LVNGRLDFVSITLRVSSHLRDLRVKLSRLQISREGSEEAKDREGSRINLGFLFSVVSLELPQSPTSRHPVLDTGLGFFKLGVKSQAPHQVGGDELRM
jgi:hypothetical protein